MKELIINADDFGMSSVFNEKILDLLRQKYVTSTSVLVDRGIENQKSQVKELVKLRDRFSISVGLHFALDNSSQKYSYEEIRSEIEDQCLKFAKVFGFDPDHLDKHKNIYSTEEAKAMVDVARDKSIFVKNSKTGMIDPYLDGLKTMSKHAFSMTLQGGWPATIQFIEELKDGETYELTCHPDIYDPDCGSSLNKEREEDYLNIIKLQKILSEHQVRLVSVRDLYT